MTGTEPCLPTPTPPFHLDVHHALTRESYPQWAISLARMGGECSHGEDDSPRVGFGRGVGLTTSPQTIPPLHNLLWYLPFHQQPIPWLNEGLRNGNAYVSKMVVGKRIGWAGQLESTSPHERAQDSSLRSCVHERPWRFGVEQVASGPRLQDSARASR